MDGADREVTNPVHLAVRAFRNFYEVVDMRQPNTRFIIPKSLSGRYTTEREAIDAIVRYLLSKAPPAYRKDGRPVFTPRSPRGRKPGSKNRPKLVSNNTDSEGGAPVSG